MSRKHISYTSFYCKDCQDNLHMESYTDLIYDKKFLCYNCDDYKTEIEIRYVHLPVFVNLKELEEKYYGKRQK